MFFTCKNIARLIIILLLLIGKNIVLKLLWEIFLNNLNDVTYKFY